MSAPVCCVCRVTCNEMRDAHVCPYCHKEAGKMVARIAELEAQLAVAKADERARCAKAITEYGEACIEKYGGTGGEMVTFELCAEHIRQLSGEEQN